MSMSGLPLQTPARETGMDLSNGVASFFAGSRQGSIDDGAYTPQMTPGKMTSMDAEKYYTEEFARQSAKLRPVLLQAIEEVIGELETTHEDVAKGAKEHIHPG